MKAEAQRALRDTRRARGVCTECEEPIAPPSRCDGCVGDQRDRTRVRRARGVAAGSVTRASIAELLSRMSAEIARLALAVEQTRAEMRARRSA